MKPPADRTAKRISSEEGLARREALRAPLPARERAPPPADRTAARL